MPWRRWWNPRALAVQIVYSGWDTLDPQEPLGCTCTGWDADAGVILIDDWVACLLADVEVSSFELMLACMHAFVIIPSDHCLENLNCQVIWWLLGKCEEIDQEKIVQGKTVGTFRLGPCHCLVVSCIYVHYTVKCDVGNCGLSRSDAESGKCREFWRSLWRVVTVIMLSFCSVCLHVFNMSVSAKKVPFPGPCR